MIEHVKAVAVYVEDQRRALDFYTQQLGFEVRRNEPMGPRGNWVEVAPPGAQTCLVLYPRSLMPSWKELKPSVLFKCDDLRATSLELAAKGVRTTEPPRALGQGTYARFADPDGNEFVLATARRVYQRTG